MWGIFHTYSNDFEHLLPRYIPIAVQVVHGEGPLELLLELAAWRHAQRAQELSKVDRAVAVRIERTEHVLGELIVTNTRALVIDTNCLRSLF